MNILEINNNRDELVINFQNDGNATMTLGDQTFHFEGDFSITGDVRIDGSFDICANKKDLDNEH